MSEKTVSGEFLGPDVATLARAHTVEALGTIIEIMRDGAVKPEIRISAAKDIIDRGHGRSVSTVQYNPSRRTAARLADLTEAELIALAKGEGGTPQNGGPQRESHTAGPHSRKNPTEQGAGSGTGNGGTKSGTGNGGTKSSTGNERPQRNSKVTGRPLPFNLDDEEVTEGEYLLIEGPQSPTPPEGDPWE